MMERAIGRAEMLSQQATAADVAYDMHQFIRRRLNAEDICEHCVTFMEHAMRLFKAVSQERDDQSAAYASVLERLKRAEVCARRRMRKVPSDSADHSKIKSRLKTILNARIKIINSLRAHEHALP